MLALIDDRDLLDRSMLSDMKDAGRGIHDSRVDRAGERGCETRQPRPEPQARPTNRRPEFRARSPAVCRPRRTHSRRGPAHRPPARLQWRGGRLERLQLRVPSPRPLRRRHRRHRRRPFRCLPPWSSDLHGGGQRSRRADGAGADHP
jgi:hypothetical protein